MVKLYLLEYDIENRKYAFHLPAQSLEDAEKIAYKIGAKVLGSDIHQIVSLPAYQLMDFCSAICDEPPKWKYNAGEQLESFLSIGWPVKPENLD